MKKNRDLESKTWSDGSLKKLDTSFVEEMYRKESPEDGIVIQFPAAGVKAHGLPTGRSYDPKDCHHVGAVLIHGIHLLLEKTHPQDTIEQSKFLSKFLGSLGSLTQKDDKPEQLEEILVKLMETLKAENKGLELRSQYNPIVSEVFPYFESKLNN